MFGLTNVVEGDQKAENHALLQALQRRSLPDLYIIDEDLRVVMSRAERELAPPVLNIVEQLLERHGDQQIHTFISPDAASVVHVCKLRADEARYAVFVSPLRTRNIWSRVGKQYSLTRRELQVVEHLARGKRTNEIADTLGITESTVIQHLKSAMSKTHSRGRLDLIVRLLGPHSL